MNIWNSKHTAALGMIIMLGACDAMDTSGGLLANLTPPEDTALPAVPLTQASMMRGGVTLVPPSGYCIDAESLTQSFAMMARCEALGTSSGSDDAPAGILTVSLSRNVLNTPLPTALEITTATGLGAPQIIAKTDDSIVFKTSGNAPSADLSPQHWRSLARVDRFTIGAALYGPKEQRAVSNEGAGILKQMIKRTTEKTNAD